MAPINLTDQLLSQHETRLNTVDQKFVQQNQKIQSINDKVTNIESKMKVNTNNQSLLNDAKNDAKFQNITDNVRTVASKIQTLETKIQTNDSKIQSIQSTTEQLKSAINKNNNSSNTYAPYSQLDSRVTALELSKMSSLPTTVYGQSLSALQQTQVETIVSKEIASSKFKDSLTNFLNDLFLKDRINATVDRIMPDSVNRWIANNFESVIGKRVSNEVKNEITRELKKEIIRHIKEDQFMSRTINDVVQQIEQSISQRSEQIIRKNLENNSDISLQLDKIMKEYVNDNNKKINAIESRIFMITIACLTSIGIGASFCYGAAMSKL